ncbi:MAG: hypothetical protein QNL91_03455 [Candidatus Krumholzibacteria bacterium]|nr:hypothetical protein [Candidatus Krumholzibacteria bacterium]
MNLRLRTILGTLWAILIFGTGTVLAQTPGSRQPVSLQFLHPVATSPDPESSANVRLSVIYGRSRHINGLDLNGGVGVTSGDVSAFQATGLYNGVGGRFQGLGLTGGLQHLRGDGVGFLFTLGANYTEGNFVGVQSAGLLNLGRSHFAGAQISGLANLNDGSGTFLQLASGANVNAGAFAGLQISAFMNAANSTIAGGQIGLLNFADNMHGFQVGAINLTRVFDGVQVGILNCGRDFTGTPIGLINMSNDDRREWHFTASNLSLVNVGFRTVLNGWSSIVSFGHGDAQGDVKSSYFLGWHYGHLLLTRPNWELTFDLGYEHIIPTKSDNPDENDNLHFALQARLMGDWRVKDHLGIIGAVGTSTVFDEYTTHATSKTDALITGGIVLY